MTSRFLFVFFIARFVGPTLLGTYGIFTATVGYALYFVGLDFYTYSTREMLKEKKTEWGRFLKSQLILSLLLYAIFIPSIGSLFSFNVLPRELMAWFFVILILEHVNQELGRLLVAISEQLLASLALFLRQGIWAILVVALMAANAETRTLNYVFAAWAISGFFAAILAMYRLKHLGISGWHHTVDWVWIIKGIKICIPLLCATLAIRGLSTLDRYWLQAIGGTEVVGAYVLFLGMASTMMAFLDAGVFAYGYPILIRTYQKEDSICFRKELRKMLRQTFIFSALFSAASLSILPFLLKWIGNSFYIQNHAIYPWLLLATFVNALGMIPHYGLYAQGKDRPIIVSHLVSVVIFAATTWLLSAIMPLLAVPIGLVSAYGYIFIWKSFAFLKLTPKEYNFALA